MWLPTPLYEALPYLYGILALVTASMFGSTMGFFSAALFAAAALLVWRMRRAYRREEDDTLHVV